MRLVSMIALVLLSFNVFANSFDVIHHDPLNRDAILLQQELRVVASPGQRHSIDYLFNLQNYSNYRVLRVSVYAFAHNTFSHLNLLVGGNYQTNTQVLHPQSGLQKLDFILNPNANLIGRDITRFNGGLQIHLLAGGFASIERVELLVTNDFRGNPAPTNPFEWDFFRNTYCQPGWLNCDAQGTCETFGHSCNVRPIPGPGPGPRPTPGTGPGSIFWDYENNRACQIGYVNCDRSGHCGTRGDARACR